MKMKDFYVKLAEDAKRYKFFFESDNEIRTKTSGKYHRHFCPITRVAFIETGKYYPEGSYQDAAKALKLRQREANSIVDASDNTGTKYKRIRQKLLKAVRLED